MYMFVSCLRQLVGSDKSDVVYIPVELPEMLTLQVLLHETVCYTSNCGFGMKCTIVPSVVVREPSLQLRLFANLFLT